MRESIFQIGSLLLILIGTFATAFPEWFKMTDYDGLFGSKLMVRKGLWLKCIRNQPGKGLIWESMGPPDRQALFVQAPHYYKKSPIRTLQLRCLYKSSFPAAKIHCFRAFLHD